MSDPSPDPMAEFQKGLKSTLCSLAQALPQVPNEMVEGQLETFDQLLRQLPDDFRREACGLLGEAATLAANPFHRVRIARAAQDLAAGRPLATPVSHEETIATYQQSFQKSFPDSPAPAPASLESPAAPSMRTPEAAPVPVSARQRLEEIADELNRLRVENPAARRDRGQKFQMLLAERDAILAGPQAPSSLELLNIASRHNQTEFGPFHAGAPYRARIPFRAERDEFFAGELLLYRRSAWSRYDAMAGYFFEDISGKTRSWDLPDEESVGSWIKFFAPVDPEIWRFEKMPEAEFEEMLKRLRARLRCNPEETGGDPPPDLAAIARQCLNKTRARRLFDLALEDAEGWAASASSGGEGLARMEEVQRIQSLMIHSGIPRPLP